MYYYSSNNILNHINIITLLLNHYHIIIIIAIITYTTCFTLSFFRFYLFVFFFLIYLFTFRERVREREQEKHPCVVASHVPLRGDLARNPGMCPDQESNQQPFGSQAGIQSTEPQQPGQFFNCIFSITI